MCTAVFSLLDVPTKRVNMSLVRISHDSLCKVIPCGKKLDKPLKCLVVSRYPVMRYEKANSCQNQQGKVMSRSDFQHGMRVATASLSPSFTCLETRSSTQLRQYMGISSSLTPTPSTFEAWVPKG